MNVPDAIVRGTAVYKVFTDSRGSPLYVVNVTDPNDVLLDAEYDVFGKVTSFTSSEKDGNGKSIWPIPFGFAGGLYDADTGFVRFGAREYDPSVGRWTSKDPILFAGGQGNLFVYVNGDPVNLVDPSGLRKEWTECEVKALLAEYRNELALQVAPYSWMAKVHGQNAKYDFWGNGHTNDTFNVPGVGKLNAAGMGNYLAGYGAGLMDDFLLSLLAVHAAGSYYGVKGYVEGYGEPGWRNWIMFGDSISSWFYIESGWSHGDRDEAAE